MKCDVAIVGAGPAGLNAAKHLASYGLEVVVVDEYPRVGGRLLGQLYEDRRKPRAERLWNGAAIAARLEQEARAAGAVFLSERTVWGIEPGWRIHVAPGPEQEVDARAVVIATGAAERPIAVPGWTLPGVMSIGAAQVFSTVHRIAPGQRVLVVGADPLSLATTGEMVAAGVNVVGVVLPSGPSAGSLGRPTEVLGRLSQASALAPNLMLRVGGRIAAGPLRGLVARLARLDLVRAWGVPIRVRTALTEVIGGTEVEAVRLAPVAPNGELGRSRKVLRVDAVCTSGGLRPLADLAQLAGCQVVDVPQVGGQVPLHSRALETRLAGLFVAGNVVGIEGAPVALAQGRVAAVSAARYLEVIGAREAETALQDALLQVEVARRQLPINFLPEIVEGHRLVESMFADPPPDGAAAPVRQTWDGVAPDLIVCRCEEVTWAALRDAIEDGATSMPGLKKRTRVCMGQCQGRICEPLVRALASDGDRPLPPHRAQVPLRPIRFGDF